MARRILITLAVFAVLAGIEIYRIHLHRTQPAQPAEPAARNENFSSDDYVSPRKLNVFDLDGARTELKGKTVWVRAGYYSSYYPYSGSADLRHPAGLLPPLDKLQIEKLVVQPSPGPPEEVAPGVRVHTDQVLAVFTREGSPQKYAVAIGTKRGGDVSFLFNDLFYFDDPHQLYSHWSKETWQAIDRHEAQKGMNELQASMALGSSTNASGGEYGNRTVEYANNGKPVKVTFAKNKATAVEQGKL